MLRTRRWLLISLGCASSVKVLSHSSAAGAAPDGSGDLAETLRAQLFDRDAARVLGRAYRERFSAEARAEVLTGLIAAALPPDALRSGHLDRRTLRAQLQARVRADFAQGETVELDDWVLSRTEARLCALCR